MSPSFRQLLFASTLLGGCAIGAARAGSPHSPAECEVWARELGFARSVAEHDAAAFLEHLDPGAVFDAAGETPTRGREAIMEAWKGLIAGDGVDLQWYPSRTVVGTGGAADVAWSSGPFLMTVRGPEGEKRIVGAFRSIWRRGADGVWHVLYDAGGDDSRPATAAEIEAFAKGRREACPSG